MDSWMRELDDSQTVGRACQENRTSSTSSSRTRAQIGSACVATTISTDREAVYSRSRYPRPFGIPHLLSARVLSAVLARTAFHYQGANDRARSSVGRSDPALATPRWRFVPVMWLAGEAALADCCEERAV